MVFKYLGKAFDIGVLHLMTHAKLGAPCPSEKKVYCASHRGVLLITDYYCLERSEWGVTAFVHSVQLLLLSPGNSL